MKKIYISMLLLSLSIVACDKRAPSEINSIKSTQNKTDKSVEFLHKIKEDLRRNNDDYADAMARRITTNVQSNIDNNLKYNYKKENTNKIIDDLNRRAYESLSEEDNATDYRETVTTTINTTVKRFSKITQVPNPTTEPIVKDMSKLKMFFAKNNELLKEFVQNKGIGTTMNMNDGGNQNIRMKARESDNLIVLPNPDQLDMAPAKGGRIHLLRIKGHLCQRNVLIPEGPKYDSKGKIYLPAFSSAPRHSNFEKAIPPKIILPRCCNCCKKSVLGCE